MRLALAAVVASLALAAPAAVAEPPPSLFGINTGTFDSSAARYHRDMPTAKALGATWVHVTGDVIKYPHGRVSFRHLDEQVNRARRLHLGMLVSLGGIKGACSVRPRPANLTDCPPTTAHDLRVYAKYLRRLLRHFRGRVHYWESWVEPNQKTAWPPFPDPAAYARLLETEHAVFRSFPGDHLIFASTNSFGSTENSPHSIAVLVFVHDVLADLHGARAFDLVGLHAYRYPPVAPDVRNWDHVPTTYPAAGCNTRPWCKMTWTGELTAFEQEFANDGYGHLPVWLTEFGWPGTATAGDAYHPTEQQQADDLRAAYAAIEQLPFIQAAFWFNLRDYNPHTPNPDPEFFSHYGLFHFDFSPKPAAQVFEQLTK